MVRPSTIDRLGTTIRDEIRRLRESGRSIDEILAHLRLLDVEVSRSALGRHVQKIGAVGERMRRSRAVAEALVEKFGEERDDRLMRLNLELMHGKVMEVLTAEEEGEPVQMAPIEMMQVGRTIQSLASAGAIDDKRQAFYQKYFEEKTTAVVKAMIKESEAKGEPLSGAEVLRRIREEVYGIHEAV